MARLAFPQFLKALFCAFPQFFQWQNTAFPQFLKALFCAFPQFLCANMRN
jgi:hypothetical protein